MARDPIHPDKFLADELESLNMTATELAKILHVPPNRIYEIGNTMSANLACILAFSFESGIY